YAGTDYQPLTIAESVGRLTFMTEAEISSGTWVPYESIVVLDQAPNDISVVSGIITQQFQSVLSHVNVLSSNRKTPNMGLRNALTNPELLKYKDQYVKLNVGLNGWTIAPSTAEESKTYFESKKPAPITLPEMDLGPRDLVDVERILPNYIALNSAPGATKKSLRDEIVKVVNAWGGKTVNYAIMSLVPEIPMQKAFGIPISYYVQFMQDNGFFDMVDAYLRDTDPITGAALPFTSDAYVRQEALRDLRNAMMKGKIDQGLQTALKTKLASEYVGPGGVPTKMRFRTSTNSEDLDAFPCAGCYESHTGDPANWENVLDAIRLAYTSIWLFRTYEERSYYSVYHKKVGMSLLVHPYFPNETANGVAVTANLKDASQTSVDGYTINVAYGGDAEVVHLPDGVTTDQFIFYVNASGNSTRYYQHWNQPLPAGRSNVLTEVEIGELATALTKIRDLFRIAYTLDSGWYAMDVEFKFAPQTDLGWPVSAPALWIKQARPYPDPNAAVVK
ncbi:MAG TPA: PEP/pyruvate-binding domain-containing protein, partial [Polyangiaceae bacterium]